MGPDERAARITAERALPAEQRLEEFVRRELEDAPPLSAATRDRIAALLAGRDGS